MSDQFGKWLCYHLRHNAEVIDGHGWADITLLQTLHGEFHIEDLLKTVEEDRKQRYTLDLDNNRIRCNQGHSVKIVEQDLPPLTPPTYLFHGTSKKAIEFIKTEGIKPMSRNHVHLSLDVSTAEDVGGRGKRGEPVILRVRAYDLWKTGVKFYLSKNGVWLTESVIPFNFTEIYYAA